MGFMVEKVRQVDCPQCGHAIDTRNAKALSPVTCADCGTRTTVPAKVGSMLITRVIGAGTGSVVYEAIDRVLARRVALKVMRVMNEDEIGRQSGLDEARALLLLDHPHVVKVFAIDTRRGQPCIIMELLDGGSLKDLIEGDRCIGEARGLEIAIAIADALKTTAERGLLHLDVKPGNVMFTADHVPKLCDFGYAAIDPDADHGEILGTPYYVSPELVRQLPPDHRADMYSLGATMFHAMTGHPPFEDNSGQESIKKILLKRLNASPPDPHDYKSDLHPKTRAVLMKMLEEDITDRHRTYDALIAELCIALEACRQRDANA